MEKLVYTIWKTPGAAELAAALADALAPIHGVRGLQINLPDARFEGGQAPIRNMLEHFDGTVSLWLDSRLERDPVEAALNTLCDGFHGYSVSESCPMHNTLPSPDSSGRIDTLSQVCLLRKPEDMAYRDWLSTWLDSHSAIAIECQTTIAYIQNIVQAPLTADAPVIHGIVEECFPVAAYSDIGLFFGAPDDAAKMQANIEKLMASTARFIPMDSIDRIFTVPYTISGTEQHAGDRDA